MKPRNNLKGYRGQVFDFELLDSKIKDLTL